MGINSRLIASLVGSLNGEDEKEEATHDEKWIINNGAGCELGLFESFTSVK